MSIVRVPDLIYALKIKSFGVCDVTLNSVASSHVFLLTFKDDLCLHFKAVGKYRTLDCHDSST